jgi:hypothetical protein
MEVSGSLQAPSNLPPGDEHRFLWNRRLGGPQSRSVIFEREIVLPVPGLESRTVQPVAWSLPITIYRPLLKITYITKITKLCRIDGSRFGFLLHIQEVLRSNLCNNSGPNSLFLGPTIHFLLNIYISRNTVLFLGILDNITTNR